MSDQHKKNEQDLTNELKDKREALRTFRFGVSGSKVKNTKEGNLLRKDIARILTELNARKNK
ncbi:MAG TPA: 50S ribosomal protein L29 [Candidatus Paceibacterota bacterium]